MIERMPREGYGCGIIRLSWQLADHIAPFLQIKVTDVQGHLEDQGVFEQVKQSLLLPENYTIHGVFLESMRRTWRVLVEAPGIPIPDEGMDLPVVTPIYQRTWDFEKGTYQARLERIDIATDPYHVLRVD